MNALRAVFVTLVTLFAISANATILSYGWALDGLWFNPAHDGQGFDVKYIERDDGSGEIFLTWNTYNIAGTKHAWIVAQGNLYDGEAVLNAQETSGGQFNNPAAVKKDPIGTITVKAVACDQALISWVINAPILGISSAGSQLMTRLSPKPQANGRYLCDNEASGAPVSEDLNHFLPMIGNGRISIFTTQGVPVFNDRAHDQGAQFSFGNLDSCSDTDYTAYCTSSGSPRVTLYEDVDEYCVRNRTSVTVPGNPVDISDKFFAYQTDGRVRVQRVSDLTMLADETAKVAGMVDVSNTMAGFVTNNRVRVIDINGTLLVDEGGAHNARVAVSDTLYATVSGNWFRVYRFIDRLKIFEVGINNDNNPIIRATNSRVYFFGSNTPGWVVNANGTSIGPFK